MPRIRQSDVDEVKSRTNIADIVGERVALKSAGVGSLKGLCPFHDERSPSFHVRPQVGYYHCFGCNESGDVYSFIRAMDHVSFTEAVERLAGRIGYTLHYEDGGAAPETSGRSRLYAANAAASEFFRSQLLARDAEAGRRFLGERGFDAGAAAHFGVGYAPKGWQGLTDHLLARKFTREELTQAGLVSQGQRGVYDRFRGRLVWPIRDVTGQVIGFGARKLYDDDQGPKYLNTPETPIYRKAQVLYGLDLAKRDMARGETRRAIIVEGYTDVMACHLAGLTTAVATCGTAFGADHMKVIRRVMGDEQAAEVVFTFDPDAAGQKAAVRAFAETRSLNAQSFVAVAPGGLDPCDLRLERGDGAVRTLMDAKVPMFEFVIDQRIRGYDLSTVEGRLAGLAAAAPLLADIRDEPLRRRYEHVLARRLGEELDEVHRAVVRAMRRSSSAGEQRPGAAKEPAPDAAEPVVRPTLDSLPRDRDTALEAGALQAVLQYGHRVDPAMRERALSLPFRHPALEAVRVVVAAAGDLGRVGWAADVVGEVREPYRTLAAELLTRSFPARNEEHAVASADDLARQLVLRALEREKAELRGAIQRVRPDSAEARQFGVQMRELDRERQRLVDSS